MRSSSSHPEDTRPADPTDDRARFEPLPVDLVGADDADGDSDDGGVDVEWTGWDPSQLPGSDEPWEDDEDGDEESLAEGVDPDLARLDEDDAEWIAGELDEIEPPDMRPFIGRVAVVGYPNVGKSTLVNRLSGTRTAIVHDTPGVTRDRNEIECDWNGERFLLVDTGGIDEGDRGEMARSIVGQVEAAIEECDVVLLVVDGKAGVSAADHEVADLLRTSRRRAFVVANKLDNVRHENDAVEFFELGLGMPIPVSAHHGNNTGDLLDIVVDELREHGKPFSRDDDRSVRIAIVGRPNVGKSTLTNAILGDRRMIVADMPGTTRDAIDARVEFEGREVIIVDTAGLRRRRSGQNPLDYYSEVRALQAAERADVAILLVDATEGMRENDLAVADHVRERDCALLVALSKWDIGEVDLGDVIADLTQKLRQRPEVVTTSGTTGRNVHKLLRKAIELHDKSQKRIGTGEFNRVLRELKDRVPGPVDKRTRRRLNLLYGTQVQAGPPKFRVYVNDKGLMTRSYGFFLENQIRERFGFEGCPLIIEYRSRA